jgi:hypothetical protein
VPEREYSHVRLPKKLGIGPEMKVALVSAPPGATGTLGSPPPGATFSTRVTAGTDLILWWPADAGDLSRRTDAMAARTKAAGLWILYPKQASGVPTDLNENLIRETVLTTGLVDNKVAAFDPTFTAMRFVPRRSR